MKPEPAIQTSQTNVLSNSNDPAAKAGLDIRRFTQAPLQMEGAFELNCSPEKLWPLVTDASGIASWFPIIYGGSHDNTSSQTQGSCDVGGKRYCKTIGMGTLDETFLHWEEPKISVYNIKNFFMPIKNHAGAMILEPIGDEKTKFTWLQYYDYKGLIMRHVFPFMMRGFMNMGVKKLAKMVGGKGGKMRIV